MHISSDKTMLEWEQYQLDDLVQGHAYADCDHIIIIFHGTDISIVAGE